MSIMMESPMADTEPGTGLAETATGAAGGGGRNGDRCLRRNRGRGRGGVRGRRVEGRRTRSPGAIVDDGGHQSNLHDKEGDADDPVSLGLPHNSKSAESGSEAH